MCTRKPSRHWQLTLLYPVSGNGAIRYFFTVAFAVMDAALGTIPVLLLTFSHRSIGHRLITMQPNMRTKTFQWDLLTNCEQWISIEHFQHDS